jgi:FdhD protein
VNLTQSVKIICGKQDSFRHITDKVVREFPLKIIVNEQDLVTLVCTPAHLDQLAVGYAFSKGLLNSKDDIEQIIDSDEGICLTLRNKTALIDKKCPKIITSSSGKVSQCDDIKGLRLAPRNSKVPYYSIYEMADVLSSGSELFKDTGGVHTALLSDHHKSFTLFREDIGRHNAVDKVIGFMILNQVLPEDKVLVISGRVSSEILIKTARSGISILVSRSAPTDLAVSLANQLGITLIGFVRGKRMNIYAQEERIDIAKR